SYRLGVESRATDPLTQPAQRPRDFPGDGSALACRGRDGRALRRAHVASRIDMSHIRLPCRADANESATIHAKLTPHQLAPRLPADSHEDRVGLGRLHRPLASDAVLDSFDAILPHNPSHA